MHVDPTNEFDRKKAMTDIERVEVIDYRVGRKIIGWSMRFKAKGLLNS